MSSNVDYETHRKRRKPRTCHDGVDCGVHPAYHPRGARDTYRGIGRRDVVVGVTEAVREARGALGIMHHNPYVEYTGVMGAWHVLILVVKVKCT